MVSDGRRPQCYCHGLDHLKAELPSIAGPHRRLGTRVLEMPALEGLIDLDRYQT